MKDNYKSPRIIALEIDEWDDESGVDTISLVEQPAIESDWIYFSSHDKFESYTDYPKAAQTNAQRAIKWAEENGWGDCGTGVGKARAHQLAKGEPISEETIARMAAFERHRQNSDTPYGEGCGKLMWDAWGGDEGIEWAQRKLKQIRKEDFQGEMEIDVYGYSTRYFYMCPFAIGTFMDLMEISVDEDTKGMIRSLAQIADNVFRIEAEVKERGVTDLEEVGEIQTLIDDFYDLMKEIESITGQTFDVSYMEKHADTVRGYIDEFILEELLKEVINEKKYISDLPQSTQDKLLEQLDEVGESLSDLEKDGWVIMEDEQEFAISSKPNEPSIEDFGKFKIRYKYSGPEDSKNRDFCAKLLKKDLVFRKEDINNMTLSGDNSQFGIYDIFQYKGSYGCRHYWTRLTMYQSEGKEITEYADSTDAATSVNPLPTMNRNPNSDSMISNDAIQATFAEQSKEKQLIAGPIMIPRKLIYRYDDFNGEYWVYFTEETIAKISYKYLKNKYQDQSNLEHSDELKLEDVTLVESWIIEDSEKDKSYALTGEKYPKGTWYGVYKVGNTSVWKEWVKTGRVKGFSVEGLFSDRIINASKHKFYYRTTEGGTEIVIDEKSFVVFILKDGERSAIMPDGTYELTNGKTLKVIDSKAEKGSF